MQLGFRLLNPQRLGAITLLLHATSAVAQVTAPEPASPAPAVPAPAPAPAAEAPAAPAVAPPPAAPASVVNEPLLAPPAPLAAAPEPPPPVEEKAPDAPVNISFWGRVDATLSNGDELNDLSSTGDFELHAAGKVYKAVSFTTNLVATYDANGISGTAGLMDGIIQIEPSDYFNIWLGRMLVPVDRSNFSGPYFMGPWYYPGFGFADGQVAAPIEGPNGRNDGITVWGQVGGGLLKYYAGVYDLYDVTQKPLFSGRVSLSLLNPEPGFYGSSTFYGKDLLGIGVGFQSKGQGSVLTDATGNITATDTYNEVNVDVLFEKNLDGAGVLDVEGAFYKFSGDYQRTDAGWFALASYLLPGEIGPGKIQPLVRVQQAIPKDDVVDSTSTLIDAQIGYVVNSYATRFALGYRNGSAGDADLQAIYFGAQFLK